jgi:hypothetical protein
VKQLSKLEGADWIGALKAPQIAALARDDGPLQMSLSGTQNFAEFTHEDFPGERLIGCRNPVLHEQRAHKRRELLAATEENLDKIVESVKAGRISDAGKIGLRVGKVVNKHKVAKHFILEIADGVFAYRRDEEKITEEARLDGLYVIRSSVAQEQMSASEVILEYKNLAFVERDFRIIKVDDLDLRPVRHYLESRVRAHVFLCMLASYLTWHLRETLAELTFKDEHVPARTCPVASAERSPEAKSKDSRKSNGSLLVTSFRDLITHLGRLTRDTINIGGQRIEKITEPTDRQRRAFELVGAKIPLSLADA